MNLKTSRLGSAGLLGLLIIAGASGATAGTLQQLAGRWSGWGTVLFDGGELEKIKCVATYFVKNEGKELTQNLRCTTSASYKISAKSVLKLAGSRLSGSWTERKSGNDGVVKGRMTRQGFKLAVKGTTFTAAMKVKTSRCSQSIDISPSGLGVKKIDITLGKC